jgi:hypothetical protein
MASRRGPRQVWLIPTVFLFVVLPIGGAVYSALSPGGEDGGAPTLSRKGSTALPGGTAALSIGAEPLSYDVTYRIERYDRDKVHESRDRVRIRRPFDGRVEDAMPGHDPKPRVSRIGSLVLSTGEGARSFVSPPAAATADLHLKPVLADAVRERLLELRERRRVLGRECQVYRAGSSVSAGELVPVGTKPGERSDFCVDRSGILLEEVWVKDGRPLLRRIATKLDLAPTLSDALFELPGEQSVPFEQGNGFLRPVDPASGFEGTIYRLASAPEGFEYLGRYVVAPPRLNPFQNRLDEEAPRSQVSLTDVWQRGPDLLALTQTIAADISAVPQNSRTGKPVDLGPFGAAFSVLDLRASEVRIELPEDRFIRVTGTLSRGELEEIATSLRAEIGTGLKFLDE